MSAHNRLQILLFLLSFCYACIIATDKFHEELLLKSLETGHVSSYFRFTTLSEINGENNTSQFTHYHLFPKSLGEILEKYSVRELHLTLTQGLWQYKHWGYPVEDAPPGAELWVWFQPGTSNIDQTWTELVNVLSGLFCASLNFMDGTTTVTPRLSFQPRGVAPSWYAQRFNQHMRYSALPRENVCTENLTPWKKLLPCSSKLGLGSLFNAIKLYDSSYHSLALHVRPVCKNDECTSTDIELTQSLTVVFEPIKSYEHSQSWTLKKIFNRHLATTCPLATSTKILVDITSNKTLEYHFKLSPAPEAKQVLDYGADKVTVAVYNVENHIQNGQVLNLGGTYNRGFSRKKIQQPVLHAHRFQTGYGQQSGGLTTLLYNNHPTKTIQVVYMETLPWFLRTYYHTLKVEKYPSIDTGENATTLKPDYIKFTPGRDRQRCYFLEMVLSLPAMTTTRFSIEFERALLKWTEYPPDANHGFYVNSAVISTNLPEPDKDYITIPQSASTLAEILNATASESFLRIHTETLLVALPTPDFSMPYNVICLACTVIAIAYGSMHNLTTRRFTLVDHTKKKGLKDKIIALFKRKNSDEAVKDEKKND